MKPRRVLIVRVGALGDVLHALPAAAALRAQEPATILHWIVDSRWRPLLVGEEGSGPVVDHAFLAETRLWSARPASLATAQSVHALWRRVRQERYDAVVDLQGTLRSAVLGSMARSDDFAGYADPRERPAALLYGRKLLRQGRHVVEQGATLLGAALGCGLTPVPFALPEHAAATQWAEERLRSSRAPRPTALLVPTAGWAAKEWPVAHFATLARRLDAVGWRVLLNAPESGGVVASRVAEASGGAATVVPCSVEQMIALMRRVDVVVGGDSGPVHLAGALARPVVALFGPTDPARNGPWGMGPLEVLRRPESQTSYRHSAGPDPGLLALTPDVVLAAVHRVTTGKPALTQWRDG